MFSSQLVWVFFLVFLVFFLSSRRYVKKTSKTPRRSSSAKTMLRKNIFSLLLFSTQLVWVFFPVFLVFFLHLAPFPTCPAPSRYAPSSFVGTRYDKKGRLCKIRKPLSPPLFIIHYSLSLPLHYPLYIKKTFIIISFSPPKKQKQAPNKQNAVKNIKKFAFFFLYGKKFVSLQLTKCASARV